MEKIEVLLEGGLGNQLFGWAAGYSVAKDLGFELVLNTSKLSHRGFQLDAFSMPSYSMNNLSTKIQKSKRLSRFNPWIFHEKTFGYDERIERIDSSKFLVGYFQSWRYFSKNIENIKPMIRKISNPSKEFLDYREKIVGRDYLIIHIRRGDYKQAEHFHGLVGQDYYSKALLSVKNQIPGHTKIVVMSDEVSIARSIIDFADLYIGPEDLRSPVENLLIMAEAKYLIGANSSFSLWAGMLMNENETIRIFPDPWFKIESIDTSDLLPPNFMKIKTQL